MKKCSKCKNVMPHSDFYKNRNCPDGLTNACKNCTYGKLKLNINKERVDAKTCGDCKVNKPASEFYVNKVTKDGLTIYCSQCSVTRSIASRFKLSKDEYVDLLSKGCSSCGSFEKLCVDHDHSCCPGQMTCGKCTRGVLCNECNTAEGFLKTSDKAAKLLQYMIRNGL